MNPRTELKNLNSFKNVKKGINAEIGRQIVIVAGGESVSHLTLLWDQVAGGVRPMRSKEESPDYRYFPEPDLPPLILGEEWLEGVRLDTGELPWDIRQRFQAKWGLSTSDADRLTRTRKQAGYFESCIRSLLESAAPDSIHYREVKIAANWFLVELRRILKEAGAISQGSPADRTVPPEEMAAFLRLVINGIISGRTGKDVLAEMVHTGRGAAEIVKEQGLALIKDDETIRRWVVEVLNKYPGPVKEFLEGKETLISLFVGNVMRLSKGNACPQKVRGILAEELGIRRDAGGV